MRKVLLSTFAFLALCSMGVRAQSTVKTKISEIQADFSNFATYMEASEQDLALL